MDQEIAIRVEGLGKRYRLGQTIDLTRTFRETLMTLPRHVAGKVLRALRLRPTTPLLNDPQFPIPNPQSPTDAFWALRDLNFEIKRGEVVGIIGRNGAGKSTLLKILSRITFPTTGQAQIHGRVGSLLEVGTGFNPELTGRENIYLNGSILGMRKAEIDRKFDEIVAFAEIDRFLDTPVKRYSSGMGVRLGFAVAAHLEPEILLVDEVLAVGDAAFQKKCMGKMDDVARSNRTVLFVSHNRGAIRSLCSTAIYLRAGQLALMDTSEAALAAYSRDIEQEAALAGGGGRAVSPARPVCVRAWGLGTKDAPAPPQILVGGDLAMWLEYDAHPSAQGALILAYEVQDASGVIAAVIQNELEGLPIKADGKPGLFTSVIRGLSLRPGHYRIRCEMHLNRKRVEDCVLGQFEILSGPFFAGGDIINVFPASALFRSEWSHRGL